MYRGDVTSDKVTDKIRKGSTGVCRSSWWSLVDVLIGPETTLHYYKRIMEKNGRIARMGGTLIFFVKVMGSNPGGAPLFFQFEDI